MKHVKRKGLLSDKLYKAIDGLLYADPQEKIPADMSLEDKTRWIHLRDAVDCGTVSPMEAYDAVKAGFVPENLCVRESHYAHLL